jgi:glycosyltransferase involved in cell wall biosynthesis
MRILHLANHCGKANGHVNVSIDLACTQARDGHIVGYACDRGDYITLLESYGVTVYHVAEPHRRLAKFLQANIDMWRAIRSFRPDVVHIHMAAQSVLLQPYRLLGYKTVTTVHNEFDRSVRLMGMASRVVTVSEHGRQLMTALGVSPKKIRSVLNGTIGSPRLPLSFTPADLAHPALVTVCGMHPRKGVIDLLHAFQTVAPRFPDAHLYLLGEGPMLDEYKALAVTLGLTGRAHFLGYCEDPRAYLAPADIFVLASHADPGPLVIGEARNAGCAVIATAVDGIPEMLDQGNAGILVPPKQPAAIAEAMTRLLSDPAELARYAGLAKQNAERFSVDRVCRDMDVVYGELV